MSTRGAIARPDRDPAGALNRPDERVLRPLTLDALEAVLAIEVTAYPHPWTRGNFIDAFAAGYWAIGLHDAQGELLSYQFAMAGHEEWHLLNLTVAPAHQGQGLALRLLRELSQHASATGAACVWLEVRPSNLRALALYERFGFQRVGVRRGYYPDGHSRREDALVLRYDVRHEIPDKANDPGEPAGAATPPSPITTFMRAHHALE